MTTRERVSLRTLALLLCACTAGCAAGTAQTGLRAASRQLNLGGWFAVTPARIPAPPAVLSAAPPSDADAREDFEEEREDALEDYESDRRKAYEGQFRRSSLERDLDCDEVRDSLVAASGPVFVLVHGIGTDGVEWHTVFEELRRRDVRQAFMYRWASYEKTDFLVEGLAGGLSGLARCVEDRPIVVMAHSAGGCLASLAVEKLDIEPTTTGPRVRLFTVASPLAGTAYRDEDVDTRDEESRFVMELGKNLSGGYPKAPPGVVVVHARTHYPADTVMKPTRSGHHPNARGVGVPGAHEVDLPADLTHQSALDYVIARLVAGDFLQ